MYPQKRLATVNGSSNGNMNGAHAATPATVAWALSYAVRGWHVFPVRPGAKTPLTEHGQNQATTDPATIERWWRDCPAANVGIHARPSGLYVVDVDCGPGKVGAAAWEQLRAENGDTLTYTVGTRSGGLHFYYTAPAGIELANTAGRLGVDIDTRGNGYVVAPPSVVEGRAYSVLAAVDPAPLPGWIVARLSNGRSAGVNGYGGHGGGHGAGWNTPSAELDLFRPPGRAFTPAEAWEFVRPRLDDLARAPDGTINHALNAAAKALSHFGLEFWPHDQAIRWLMDALSFTVYDGRTWRAEQTIDSAYRSAERDWRAELRPEGARFPNPGVSSGTVAVGRATVAVRRVDPSPWLDGTHVAPEPTVGVVRNDSTIDGWGGHLLYAGAWHTVVGPTESGKSWFAIAHLAEEMRAGRSVAYAHFEESNMGSTVARLIGLGLDKELIRERFAWLDCNERWAPGEFGEALGAIWPDPSIVVLDGIIAACTRHGQDPEKVGSVGWYRETFVVPATMNGAAVLSLGHPAKGRERATERHGFGSTAWLDEVDGVGFRLEPHPAHPIRRGASGTALLYSAKDRHGGTSRHGTPDRREGWVYLGSLCVDNAHDPNGGTKMWLTAPRPEEVLGQGGPADPIDILADAMAEALATRENRAYDSQADLEVLLNQKRVKYTKAHVAPALDRLEGDGVIERDPAPVVGKARGGHLRENPEVAESVPSMTENV